MVNVSWYDVRAFIEWLSRETGRKYRLPSENEWEYAARSGASTTFSWGNVPGRNNANCDGCASRWDDLTTAPIGSFPPNGFGLYDVHGNVWEWIDNCGSGACTTRILRGGSWTDKVDFLTFPSRLLYTAENRANDAGFRLVRELVE